MTRRAAFATEGDRSEQRFQIEFLLGFNLALLAAVVALGEHPGWAVATVSGLGILTAVVSLLVHTNRRSPYVCYQDPLPRHQLVVDVTAEDGRERRSSILSGVRMLLWAIVVGDTVGLISALT